MYRNKPVTRKDLANRLGIDVKFVEQFGSRQMFIVWELSGLSLYSYFTKVGFTCIEDGKAIWVLTTEKYSPTTSKQLTQFANDRRRNGYEIRYSAEI